MHKTIAALIVLTIVCATADALAREPGWHKMKRGIVGCRESAEFDRVWGIRLSGDQKAFEKAAAVAILAGDCAILKQGTEVYMEEIKMLGGVAKVRARGETRAYWIDYSFMD